MDAAPCCVKDYRTPKEAQPFRELSCEVLQGSREIVELEDGYRLVYPANDRWRRTLTEFVAHVREQFEWLDFELDEAPGRIAAEHSG